jgi:hypothetical protein
MRTLVQSISYICTVVRARDTREEYLVHMYCWLHKVCSSLGTLVKSISDICTAGTARYTGDWAH